MLILLSNDSLWSTVTLNLYEAYNWSAMYVMREVSKFTALAERRFLFLKVLYVGVWLY